MKVPLKWLNDYVAVDLNRAVLIDPATDKVL